jgi:hypothetical protein
MVTSPMNRVGAEPPDAADIFEWTEEEIGTLFKKACARKTGVAFMLQDRKIEPVGTLAPGAEKVIHWATRYCSRQERLALLLWCMADSWKAEGRSVRSFIRDMGWDLVPSTVHRQRIRAIKKIAAGLKRDRIPKFSL